MWLKRATPQNIVIGGAAGALPPVIGWAAASGAIGTESAILFLIIFLWTPPHFWALALFKAGDYAAAGIPMMPNVAGEASTRRQIFVYSCCWLLSGYCLGRSASQAWRTGLSPPHSASASSGMAGSFWSPATSMKSAKALFSFSMPVLCAISQRCLSTRLSRGRWQAADTRQIRLTALRRIQAAAELPFLWRGSAPFLRP